MMLRSISLCGRFRLLMLMPLLAGSAASAQQSCLPAVDAALAQDVEAASGESEKQPWSEVEKRYAAAERAWDAAARQCQGEMRDTALENQAEARRGREYAASQVSSPACEQASGNAVRLMDFAKAAWSDKRWEQAALWSRKADLAWELALAQCNGAKRDLAAAKRAAARLDAHNAIHCSPRWQQATELSAALKAKLPALAANEKLQRRDRIELAWGEAAKACKGAAAEQAQASAAAFAQARGARPLSVMPPANDAADSTNMALTRGVAAKDSLRQRMGGVSYSGQFRRNADGLMEGQGRVEWDNGDSYEGPLVAGKAQGKGVFVWKSGQRYEGDLADGRPSGHGVMRYAGSGDRYEGEFEAGLPHGQGTYIWKNGDRYAGAWAHGQMHGNGRYTWDNGSFWEGEYANGERLSRGPVVVARSPSIKSE